MILGHCNVTSRRNEIFFLRELSALGIAVEWKPTATFYVWADLSALPHPINDSLVFLEEAVRHKVICVPGVFFDINPRGTRNMAKSKCISFVRFSYGPPMEHLEKGIDQIGKMIKYWKSNQRSPSTYAETNFDD